jgi:lysophospholipid acyltransferase (LPLAT)-like uncharacterized protein
MEDTRSEVVSAATRKRPLLRRIRRRLHPIFGPPLLAVAQAIVPRLYVAYMWLVWKTSYVEDCGYGSSPAVRDEHNGLVALLWHEEVFSAAWDYRTMRPHTLANVGDSGDMITRILERCGYVVFRGGSSKRASRRRDFVFAAMSSHMKTTDRVVYGIAVDGSYGPYHEMKPGGLWIAFKCKKPVVLVRTWAKRNLRLPTWDRLAVPLPFNHIRQFLRGPFFVPSDASDPAVFERFRLKMQSELVRLAEESQVW